MIDSRFFVVYLGVFGSLGIGAGMIGFLSVQWAESVYLISASGDLAQQLGPIFSGFVVLQNSILIQFFAIHMTLLLGLLFGGQKNRGQDGALVGGLGGLIGYLSFFIPAVGLLLVAPTESQLFQISSILLLVAGSFVISGLTGAVGGFIGAEAN
jgi:hypothetical protein